MKASPSVVLGPDPDVFRVNASRSKRFPLPVTPLNTRPSVVVPAGQSSVNFTITTQAVPAAATGGAPNLKGTTLSVLLSAGFVPESDPYFKKQVEEGFVKETGAQVNVGAVGAKFDSPEYQKFIAFWKDRVDKIKKRAPATTDRPRPDR